jgi:CRP-like cAMP-binding protein
MDKQDYSDKLYSFFKTDFPLNKDGLDELISSFKTENFKRNTILIESGKVENNLRFLVSGIVREYYAKDEKETNINFYTFPQFINDFSSFNFSKKTNRFQECLTPVVIKYLDKKSFQRLLEKYQCGKSFIEQTFQRLLEQKEQFEFERITKSPDELYKSILELNSDWLIHIPQYHIASFMGITPETLSRIRKRIS